MSTTIQWRRQQEIIEELHLASRYFQRLSTEFNQNENLALPGDEWQMAQHIHESILLLQWRLETLSLRASHGLTQPSVEEHSAPPRLIGPHTVETLLPPEQSMTEQRSIPILHNKSD